MKKDILQKFIDLNGKYLIGQRLVKYHRSDVDDDYQTFLLAPDVSREFWVDDIGTIPFNDVKRFSDEEIRTNINLGKEFSPFQYGITRNSFINLKEVTCKPMELVLKCYKENITDYYKVIEAMESLTHQEQNNESKRTEITHKIP